MLHHATVPRWWQLTWSHIIWLPDSILLFAGPPPPDRHIVTGQSPGQVVGGEPCGGPAATAQYTVSLVQWVNRLLPAKGQCFPTPGCNLQWNWVLLLAMSHYMPFFQEKRQLNGSAPDYGAAVLDLYLKFFKFWGGLPPMMAQYCGWAERGD